MGNEREGLDDWITPFEQYLLAMKHKEENKEKTKKRKSQDTIDQSPPNKMYSHKDKAERIPAPPKVWYRKSR